MFPTTPLAKHTPLELVLTPPRPGRERALVIRDVGAVENTWVAEELVMSYFDGKVISPPVSGGITAALCKCLTVLKHAAETVRRRLRRGYENLTR